MPAPQGYCTRTLRDFVGHGFGAAAPLVASVGSAAVIPADASVDDKGPKGQLLRFAAGLNFEGSDKPALVGDVPVFLTG